MGEAIGSSTCSHTPVKHAGTSKGGITLTEARASHEYRKIGINWTAAKEHAHKWKRARSLEAGYQERS